MRKQSDWAFRLNEELNVSVSAFFVTLTYQYEQPLDKRHIQLFLKRIRKKTPVRYYLVGEYGSLNQRAHYHAIMFNLPDDPYELIKNEWIHGLIHIGTVTPASIAYVTKYVITKVDYKNYPVPPFAMMSTKPPLGIEYLTGRLQYHKNGLKNYTVIAGGVKIPLPRIYTKKMFNYRDMDEIKRKLIDVSDEKERITPTDYEQKMYSDIARENLLKRMNKKNAKL